MSLAAPGWLLLALPLGTALWLLRLPGRTLASLRALAFGCLVLGLAGLAVDLPLRAGSVVVVVDRSRSNSGSRETPVSRRVARISTMFWGPRVPVDEAYATIREWIRGNLA